MQQILFLSKNVKPYYTKSDGFFASTVVCHELWKSGPELSGKTPKRHQISNTKFWSINSIHICIIIFWGYVKWISNTPEWRYYDDRIHNNSMSLVTILSLLYPSAAFWEFIQLLNTAWIMLFSLEDHTFCKILPTY